MKKILLVLIIGSLCFPSIAKIVTFGTEATYAPFENYNEYNQLIGFDVDIAKRICEINQFNCEFRNQSFDSLIPSLKTRRIDAAIAGIDITPMRSKQVLFSDSYYQNAAKFFAKENIFETIDSLKNKRIGVQNGTTHQKYLMENYPDMKIVSYNSYQNAVLDLRSDRIDAIFSDAAVSDVWLSLYKNLTIIGQPVSDPDYFGLGLAIAVRKGSFYLVNKFNKALKEMRNDGSYQKIYNKWFANKYSYNVTK